MSTDVFNVTERTKKGSAAVRRLRRDGLIPAVLYGHGESSITLQVDAGELAAAVRHGVQMVDLKGAANETALISEIQWDAIGSHILHLDLMRVRADEVVEVEVAVVLRGEAPGVKQGGTVEQQIHEIEVECRARAIPEGIEVNVNELELDQAILVSDLELPKGVKTSVPQDAVVVSCFEPVEVLEEETEETAQEPEVIGEAEDEEPSEA